MKRLLLIISASFCFLMQFTVTPVLAGTNLTSAPLPGGSDGFTCACSNLTKKEITITLEILTITGGGDAETMTMPPWSMRALTLATTNSAICRAARQDGKNLTTKQVACSFVSEDSTGRLVLPLDHKLQKQ